MGQFGFWIAAGAVVAMVGIVLFQALRQGRALPLDPAGTQDVQVYRDQLAEVDRDLSRGTLARTEAERLKTEISRRLLAADARLRQGEQAGVSHWKAGMLLAVLALAGGIAVYAGLGQPGYGDLPLERRLALAQTRYEGRPSQVESEARAPKLDAAPDVDPKLMGLIAELRQAMQTHPDDPQGLALLARYEGMLGNFPAAAVAQRHLIEVKGAAATAEERAALAELMIMAAGGAVSPEAEEVLRQTLQQDPRNAPARYYTGLMMLQVGRPDQAFEFWQALLTEGPQDAPWIGPIRDQIEEVAAAAGIRYQLPRAEGPSAGDMAAAAEMSPEDRQKMIEGMVAGLEARLMQQGGSLAEWQKLINALGVLGQTQRAQAAYDKARADLAANPGDLSALQAVATQAGLTP